jgi:hypothetical protein
MIEDALALVQGDADDAPGETSVDIERLLPGHRVGAHDRMLGARVLRLVGDAVIGVLAAIMLAVVLGSEPVG